MVVIVLTLVLKYLCGVKGTDLCVCFFLRLYSKGSDISM